MKKKSLIFAIVGIVAFIVAMYFVYLETREQYEAEPDPDEAEPEPEPRPKRKKAETIKAVTDEQPTEPAETVQ